MSAQIAVSLISAAVALVSVYLSTRAARGTARLSHELDLAKRRATKEEQVEELMSRYREPLLRAAFDLQSRIYNIIKQDFLIRYGAGGRDHEREYALDNTLFLFAQYFGWVELLRRDVQFLDLGDVERNRLLVERLESIADTLASDRRIAAPPFRIFRGEQRALGEVMIQGGTNGAHSVGTLCIGYAQFRQRLRAEETFAEWFSPWKDDISALIEADHSGYERLTKLQHALVDLIAFLDDPPRRFIRALCNKL